MKVRITDVDYAPEELYAQIPVDATLLREIPGSDRPDYWLALLSTPIRQLRDGFELVVMHIVLSARYDGERIGPGFRRIVVNIAYVVDEKVLSDAALDFKKCHRAGIGTAEEID